MNEHNQKYSVDTRYFSVIDTEEKAYWLGFIMADGCIYEQHPTYRFQINLKRGDRDILIRLSQALQSTYPIIDKEVNGSQVSQLKINSKVLCQDLMKYGIVPRKSGKEFIPDIQEDLIPHFIRGYFDGDGCLVVGKTKFNKPRAKYCIVSGRQLLEQICEIVKDLGYNVPEKAIQQTGKAYTLNLSSIQAILHLRNYMYQNANIYLQRKYDKFTELIQMI